MSIKPIHFVDTLGHTIIVRPVTDQQSQAALFDMSKDVYAAEKIPYDYLPTYFIYWLKTSNHWMYGIEVDGRLVGFSCKTLLDEGRTHWGEGLRIHKAFREMSLSYMLLEGSNFLFRMQMKELMIKKNNSRFKHGIPYQLPFLPIRQRYTKGMVGLNITARKKEVKKHQNESKSKGDPVIYLGSRYSFVLRLTSRVVNGLRHSFFKDIDENHNGTVINSTPESTRRQILDSVPPLIPCGVIITDWVGYDLNVDLKQNQWKYQYWWAKKNNISSLSLNTIMPRVAGPTYEAVIYTTDLQSVYVHLQHHIGNMQKINSKNYSSNENQKMSYLNVWVNEEVISQLQPLFQFAGEDLLVGRTCMLYEKPGIPLGKL